METATFADVRRKVIHLKIKATGEDKYYSSLQALFNDNNDLGVSKYTLDRYNFETPFENLKVIIKKGELFGTGDIKRK